MGHPFLVAFSFQLYKPIMQMRVNDPLYQRPSLSTRQLDLNDHTGGLRVVSSTQMSGHISPHRRPSPRSILNLGTPVLSLQVKNKLSTLTPPSPPQAKKSQNTPINGWKKRLSSARMTSHSIFSSAVLELVSSIDASELLTTCGPLPQPRQLPYGQRSGEVVT